MERFGAPTVREIDATFLASVKRSHAVLVAFWVTVSVMVAGTGNPSGQALTNAAFFCGGIYEAVIRARLFEEETIGKALGQWFGSFLVGLVWTGFVFGPMVGLNWVISFPDYQMEACGAGAAAQQPVLGQAAAPLLCAAASRAGAPTQKKVAAVRWAFCMFF